MKDSNFDLVYTKYSLMAFIVRTNKHPRHHVLKCNNVLSPADLQGSEPH